MLRTPPLIINQLIARVLSYHNRNTAGIVLEVLTLKLRLQTGLESAPIKTVINVGYSKLG